MKHIPTKNKAYEMFINSFRDCKSPQNPSLIPIDDYVSLIKDGFNVYPLLIARKHPKGSEEYDKVKLSRPVVTFNFQFKDYLKANNITGSTGLLYYDIDKPVNELNLNQDDIFISHNSFGGIGSTVIVQASGITTDNFRDSYYHIADTLNITQLLDKSAVKKTQYTVLSYDPYIMYNTGSTIYHAVNKKVSYHTESKRKKTYQQGVIPFYNNVTYRTTNATDYLTTDQPYEVFPNYIHVAEIVIPRFVKEGNRTKTLMGITNNIMAINPYLSFDALIDKAVSANNYMCNDPLPFDNVITIANSIFKYYQEGTLKPILNKKRKIIFNPAYNIPYDEKMSIVNKELGCLKVDITLHKIHEAIENWNKPDKITAESIALEINMSKITVKRYWKEFKEIAAYYNHNLKLSIQQGLIPF